MKTKEEIKTRIDKILEKIKDRGKIGEVTDCELYKRVIFIEAQKKQRIYNETEYDEVFMKYMNYYSANMDVYKFCHNRLKVEENEEIIDVLEAIKELTIL